MLFRKSRLIFFILFFSLNAHADCYRDCMETSGCWSFGVNSGEASYCSGIQARCSSDCLHAAPEKSFGAIAYSVESEAYGWSKNWKDQKSAEERALKNCGEHGLGCEVMVWFYNSCGAVAADGRATGWGQAATAAAAKETAIKDCAQAGGKACEVKISACSFS